LNVLFDPKAWSPSSEDQEDYMLKKLVCATLVVFLAGLCFAAKIPDKVKVRNLTAFARLYGYVKHWYPADEAEEIDWNRFAVYGAGQVVSAPNDVELQKLLLGLFRPIVPDLQLYAKRKPELKQADIVPGRKKVFWQYKGYNTTMNTDAYTSLRTNRPFKIINDPREQQSWAAVTPQIPPGTDPDSKYRVAFRIRQAEGDTLTSHFHIRYQDNSVEDSLRSSEWIEKSFVLEAGTYPQESLWIGLWDFNALDLDDLRVDLWHGNDWQPAFASNFESDLPGSWPANFNLNYSPSDGLWGQNAEIEVKGDGNNNYLSLKKTGPDSLYTRGFISKVFEEELPFGEMLDKRLVPGLNCLFPLVLQCDPEHTYPVCDPGGLDSLGQKLVEVQLEDRDDPFVWLAGVIKYWNQLQFFFPYFEYGYCDWEKELGNCLARCLRCRDFDEYRQTLRLLMSKTRDGHAFLVDRSSNYKTPGFNTVAFAGKWFVSTTQGDSLGIPAGSEVVSMNGKPFAKLMREARPRYITSNPETTDLKLFYTYLQSYPDSVATFEFLTPDKRKLKRRLVFEEYEYWKWGYPEDNVVKYDDGIVYVNANLISDGELQEAMPDLLAAKGIILDLREYPSISMGLITHLLTEPDSLSNLLIKRYIRPNEELPRQGEGLPAWNLQPAEPHIGARVVALCSRLSQSYCEQYLANLKHNKLATLVGQPTAGSNGNVVRTYLPGNLWVYWTGMLVRNPDHSRFFGVGVVPDVVVKKTLQDIINGKDPELEKALELMRAER
jgi:hypothetical protein